MKKKIILPIMFLIFTITLVSCLSIGNYNNKVYKSNNHYEQKLIDVAEIIDNQTVAVVDESKISRPSKVLGSATIIKKDKSIGDSTYYALTSDEVINSIDKKIYITNSKIEDITDYAVNKKYGIAIIKFKSRYSLDVAKFSLDSLPENISAGQTVLSRGLDSVNSYPITTKEGYVTNVNATLNDLDSYFTHDISNNAGETGAGVYSLSGTLVGINVKKVWHDYNTSSEENILGLSYALKISEIFSVFNELEDLDYITHSIKDSQISSSTDKSIYKMDTYESSINEVYLSKQSSVVQIINGNLIQSGIIINKTNNLYQVLTISLDKEIKSNLKVKTVNNNYDIKDISIISNNISVITFESSENYQVEKIENSNYLRRGQTVLTIGSSTLIDFNSLNVGTLSKPTSEYENYFMHSTKANNNQIGSPIYNLSGNLIGIHVGKINSIQTQTGEIVGEALSYGLKIETIIEELDLNVNLKGYEAIDDYEKTIIEVTESVLNKTVTVKTDSGHGSGVLFKREKKSDGSYVYSVLTNQHVVSSTENSSLNVRSEISVSFNDDIRSIRVKDVYLNRNYDLAILRFESFEKIEVINSKSINNNEHEDPIKGQVVVAVGTPQDINRIGYVTTGVFTSGPNNYQGQSQLGLLHTAPLNPGNSGGPLFNLKGELIGLNVAKATFFPKDQEQVFSERISITLNINKIANLYNSSIDNSSYIKMPAHTARIGITVTEINVFREEFPNLKDYLPNTNKGIVIINVDDLYDAYGKLKAYDVITNINGIEIKDNSDVAPIISGKDFGFKLVVTVLRVGLDEPLVIEVLLS